MLSRFICGAKSFYKLCVLNGCAWYRNLKMEMFFFGWLTYMRSHTLIIYFLLLQLDPILFCKYCAVHVGWGA